MATTSPEAIRQATEEVLTSGDYRLDVEENALNPFWQRLLDMLGAFLRWFADLFSFLDGMPQFVRWSIVTILLVALVLLIWHILYSIVSAMRPARNVRGDGFSLHERKDDPRVWEQQALELGEAGNYVGAARLLLRASLFRLEDSFDRPFRRATTNREYLRKYRKLPVLDDVRQLVDTIDRKWYGEEPCDREDYEQCRSSHASILELVRSRQGLQQESA